MAANEALSRKTYELEDAIGELRLHMEAMHALYLLMESTYFEPEAERFFQHLTVPTWKRIQLNFYTLTGLVSSCMKECRAVEGLAAQLHEYITNSCKAEE